MLWDTVDRLDDWAASGMAAIDEMMAVYADNCDSPIVHPSLRRPEPYRCSPEYAAVVERVIPGIRRLIINGEAITKYFTFESP